MTDKINYITSLKRFFKKNHNEKQIAFLVF